MVFSGMIGSYYKNDTLILKRELLMSTTNQLFITVVTSINGVQLTEPILRRKELCAVARIENRLLS